MFKKGDLVRRLPEHQKDSWWVANAGKTDKGVSGVYQVLSHPFVDTIYLEGIQSGCSLGKFQHVHIKKLEDWL